MAIFPGSAIPSAVSAYEIENSLRFNEDDSAYLSWTPSGAGSDTKATVSVWIKVGHLTGNRLIYSTGPEGTGAAGANSSIELRDNDIRLMLNYPNDTTPIAEIVSSAVFRDPSAWYHLVVAWDTTEGTASDRIKTYVNNERITSWSTSSFPASEDQVMNVNHATPNNIGRYAYTESNWWDGYMAEFYKIDGTAYTPSDFGELNATTNQWIPKDAKDDLTFGTNGFYQKYGATELANSFTDSSGSTWTCPAGKTSVTYLVVAGGGGGGSRRSGGGGAGGLKTGTLAVTAGVDYSITIGAGGAGGGASEGGSKGEDSVFATITSTGGGGGAVNAIRPSIGGSGGGGSGNGSGAWNTGASGTVGQGYAGGDGINGGNYPGGGGGGSSAVGGTPADNTSASGDGGAGTASSISGGSVTYAGGGGGGGPSSGDAGAGGTGGGGAGSTSGNGSAGTDGLGGGGGGGFTGTSDLGGKGGSGIVILDDGTTVTSFTSLDHTITANGDVTNTRAVRKVGDSSILFDGSNDYLSIPDSTDWDLYETTATTFTYEAWIKFDSAPSGSTELPSFISQWEDDDNKWSLGMTTGEIQFYLRSGGSTIFSESGGTITDTNWHHVAWVKNGTSLRTFVDGVLELDTTKSDTDTLSGGLYIGTVHGATYFFDGHMTEIRVSDVARYTSTFTPSTTAFTADANTLLLIHSNWDGGLGADSSGNYNTFTPTNLVATDQMIDTPTNNFATLNPLDNYYAGNTFSEGNLKIAQGTSGPNTYNSSTISMYSGKWYSEFLMVDDDRGLGYILTGISSVYPDATTDELGDNANAWAYYGNTGNYWNNNSGTSYGNTYTEGDLIGVALDLDNNKLYFSKNGTWQDSGDPTSGATGTGAISITTGEYRFCIGSFDGGYAFIFGANFGSDSSFAGSVTAQGNQDGNEKGDFYYTPPTDYLALCSDNLPTPEIALPGKNFNTIIYDDGAGAKTGVGFQPDLVWVKSRGSAYDHKLTDAVRGVTKAIVSLDTTAETTDSTGLTAFGADGFTVGADTDYSDTTGTGMVAWNWKGDGVAGGTLNEDGSLDSQVNVNTTAGFSIVKYSGVDTPSTNTVGHGLSVAPELYIIKSLTAVSPAGWVANTTVVDGTVDYMFLNTDAAVASQGSPWSTLPTASVFTLGANDGNTCNDGVDYIAYCFHSIEGYSKVTSYVGNGNADGPFIYTGFRPAFVMVKSTTAVRDWLIHDDKRNTYNAITKRLYPNLANAEETYSTPYDFVSNGLKTRSSVASWNGSGETHIVLAFAESPFKTANAR